MNRTYLSDGGLPDVVGHPDGSTHSRRYPAAPGGGSPEWWWHWGAQDRTWSSQYSLDHYHVQSDACVEVLFIATSNQISVWMS